MSGPRRKGTLTVVVWDRTVRLLHWSLLASVVAAGLSTLAWFIDYGSWHQPAGYVALAAVLLRLVWGCIGSRHARWRGFVRSPQATWRYLQRLCRRREPRYLGHNPLGAWMVLALIACLLGLALTGWLHTTDRYWGDETVESVHIGLSWSLLALAVLHVAGVVFTGLRHHENLVRSMITGRKPAPQPSDIG
ncbi:MAG: cytochrome b/b6 domain-containing protein [Pseudomonadota bacterium]|nr:cytochrome b/b6 domain-containing protein [Pseudomonadota bacterium]